MGRQPDGQAVRRSVGWLGFELSGGPWQPSRRPGGPVSVYLLILMFLSDTGNILRIRTSRIQSQVGQEEPHRFNVFFICPTDIVGFLGHGFILCKNEIRIRIYGDPQNTL